MLKFPAWIFSVLVFFSSAFALAAVDLNQASIAELETLPGVGARTAKAIVAARPFHSVDELKNVRGIGDTKFKAISPLVTAGTMPAPTPTSVGSNIPQEPAMITNKAPTVDEGAARAIMPGRADVIANPEAAAKKAPLGNERINLNTASLQDLERLPGIGPAKAEAILQARPFHNPDDVMKVKGIKAGTFAKIKNNITIE